MNTPFSTDSQPGLSIVELSEVPEYLQTVGQWIYNQWWRNETSLDYIVSRLKGHLKSAQVPFTLIALLDGNPVGTASVIEEDLEDRKQYSPWLAAVLVLPDHRRRGIGSALVKAGTDKAHGLGVETLYLNTLDQAEFYSHAGWSVVERDVGKAGVTVMAHLRAPKF